MRSGAVLAVLLLSMASGCTCGGQTSQVDVDPITSTPDTDVPDAGTGPTTPADAGPDLTPDAGGNATDAGTGSTTPSSDAGTSVDAGAQADAGVDFGGTLDAGASNPLPLDAGTSTDAGAPVDAGSDTTADAGMVLDAGTAPDAGVIVVADAGAAVDAGTPEVDAGADPVADAGSTTDAGSATEPGTSTDAGSETDAGSATEPGTSSDAGSVTDAGSTTEPAVDAGAPSDAGAVPDPVTEADAGTAADAGTEADAGAAPSDPVLDAGTEADAGTADPVLDAGTEADAGVPARVLPTAGADARVCAGGSTVLGLAEEPGLVYAWSPATGLSASDVAQPTATPGATTTYTLTVSDPSTGATRESQVTVAVQSLPRVHITTEAGAALAAGTCSGTGWMLSGATTEVDPSASVASYQWLLPDGSSASTERVELAVGEGEGVVWLGLTVTDSFGCSATESLPVEIYPRPVADAGPDQRMASGGSVGVGGPASGGLAPYAYAWSSDLPGCDGLACIESPTAESTRVAPAQSASFTVTVTDARSCESFPATAHVEVLPPLVADAGADVAICAGDSADIGQPAQGGLSPYTYAWTSDVACAVPGCLADPAAATTRVTPSSTTSFTQQVTDAFGTTASASVTVQVSQRPGVAGADSYLARGASTAIGPSPTAGATYTWTCNRDDCALSDPAAAQPVAQPLKSTRYALTALNGACSVQSTRTVWVELDAQTTPVDGATDFPVNAVIEVRFSDAVDRSTVTQRNLQLVDAAGVAVSFTFALDATDQVLTIRPSASLAAGADYTLTLASGLTGIVSSDPVLPNLLAPTVIDFTTAAADVTAASVTYRSPAAGETGVEPNRTVLATFSEPVASATVSTSTFQVHDPGGVAVAGAVTYDPASLTATFRPSAPLAYDTTYTVVVAGVTDLSGNVTNVTWSFTTGAQPDVTPPQVTAVSPASGAVGVSSSAQVLVSFSEAVDAASLSGITLTHVESGTRVAGTVSYDATTHVATFAPRTLLEGSSTYLVDVTGVLDLSGNTMASAFQSTFSTSTTLFSDDFEGGLSRWTTPATSAGLSWGLSTSQYASATHSFTDSPAGKYGAKSVSTAELASPIGVAGLGSVTVQVAVRTGLVKGSKGGAGDTFAIEYQLDGGAWVALKTWTGSSAWARHTLALPLPGGSTQLKLRVRLTATGTRTADGAYVDDLIVQAP